MKTAEELILEVHNHMARREPIPSAEWIKEDLALLAEVRELANHIRWRQEEIPGLR